MTLTPNQRTAQAILAEDGQRREHRPPAWPALVELARDYLRLAGPDVTGPRESLTDGPEALYVSLAAAQEYRRHVRAANDEAARRQLTELLIDAKQSATDLSSWRMRSKSTGIDITARIAIECRLLVVAHVEVRDYNTGGSK